MKKLVMKYGIKLIFFGTFLGFSYESLADYIHGSSVYDNINEINKTLVFPSVTLCPRPEYTMAYLDVDQYLEDFNSPNQTFFIKSAIYHIFRVINENADPGSFVDKYSFPLDTLEANGTNSQIK